jgi:hypothetical protein
MTESVQRKSGGSYSKLNLNSHDVTVISAIAQQRGTLPKEFLSNYAAEAQISPDALEIVTLILAEPTKKARSARGTRTDPKESVADQFRRWVFVR